MINSLDIVIDNQLAGRRESTCNILSGDIQAILCLSNRSPLMVISS